MATRIGKYYFEDTLEDMSIEKLDVLAEACEFYKKKKLAKELASDFTALNLRAHALGFDLCYVNPDDNDDKYVLNQYTFAPVERKE